MKEEFIYMRVIPYVRTETVIKNGVERQVKVDNLSSDEIRKMSVKIPKILQRNSDGNYILDETSVTFKGTGLRMLLCFDYSELTLEEQAKYFSRSKLIPVIIKKEEVKTEVPKTRKKNKKQSN